jgi:hypothetical protein
MTLPERTTSHLEDLFAPGPMQYFRFPAPCSAAAYGGVVDRFVERARKVRGVLGVGRFGNVSAPGISDLDLVVVTEPDVAPDAGEHLTVNSLPEFDRGLMMHDPMLVPEDGIGHVFDHLDLPGFTPVWGRLPASPQYSGQADRWRRLSVLLEWLPAYQYYFAALARTRRVDVRWALPMLHSLRHPLALAAETLGEPIPGGDCFTQEVQRLRSEWFAVGRDGERVQRLAGALARGWELSAEMCFRMDRWLLAEGMLPCLDGSPAWSLFASGGEAFVVMARVSAASDFTTGQLKFNRPLRGLSFLPRKIRSRLNPFTFTVLPSFPLAPLRALVARAPIAGGGQAGQCVAGRPCEAMQPRSDFEHYLAGLAERVEHQACFMKKNGLAFGQVCSFLLFDPARRPPPPQSWRKRLLRAVHVRRAVTRIAAITGRNGSES